MQGKKVGHAINMQSKKQKKGEFANWFIIATLPLLEDVF